MKDRLARGFGWLAAARVLINVIAFASTLLLARLLMPDDFGLVAIAMTVAAIVTSLTELSMGSALIQHKDPQASHFDSAFTLNVARAVLVGAIIAALAHPVAQLYGDPRLTELLIAIAATTVFSGFNNPKLVTFTRNLLFRQEFIMTVLQKLVSFVVAIAIAWVYHSYWALFVGSAAAQVVTLGVSYVLLPYRPHLSLSSARDLLSFSVWLSLGQAVNTLNWKSDSLFAGYFLGSGPLGYYSFGDNLASLPTREATAPIAQTLFPAFARLIDDPARLRAAYQQSQALLCAVALPLGCGFAMIAGPLINVTVGDKWAPSVFIIQLLAGVFALQTLGSTLQPLAMAMGKTQTLFKRDLVNFGVRIPLILVGLYLGGLVGIVWARVVSGITSTLINMLLVRTLLTLPLWRQFAANLRSLISVVIMMAVIGMLQRTMRGIEPGIWTILMIATWIVIGGVIYIGSMFCMWTGSGRPNGPERVILNIIIKINNRADQSMPPLLSSQSPRSNGSDS